MNRQDLQDYLRPNVQLSAIALYNALLTIVRQNAQGHPTGHDAIVHARKVLAMASLRRGVIINWAKEKKL
jgi:hypothetical protein